MHINAYYAFNSIFLIGTKIKTMLYYNIILLNNFLILDSKWRDKCIYFTITCTFVCVYLSSLSEAIKMLQFSIFCTYGSW